MGASKEFHNHRPPVRGETNSKGDPQLSSHLPQTIHICKNGSRCIKFGCQNINREKPRFRADSRQQQQIKPNKGKGGVEKKMTISKHCCLSEATNILLAFFFLALLILALFTSRVSCNIMQKFDSSPIIKFGSAQRHDSGNAYLRTLLSSSQPLTTHLHQSMPGQRNNNNIINNNDNNNNNNDFMSRKMSLPPQAHNLSPVNVNQMMVNSNHVMSVPHIGHQNLPPNLGVSETSSYNSITSLQDYPERVQSGAVGNNEQVRDNGLEPSIGSNGPSQPSSSANVVNDEPRSGFNEYQGDQNSFEPNSSIRSSNQNGGGSGQSNDQQQQHQQQQQQQQQPQTNSRSSVSEAYLKPSTRDSASGGLHPLRSSLDPFEDIGGGGPLSTSEYERDLADLDEEFNRHTYRRPPGGSMVSDSYMTLSPERYEPRRYNRRPLASYADYSGDYLNTAGSMSSIVPRAYQRGPSHWSAAGSPYSDNSDLWTDSNIDFSPLPSYVSPNHYTTYRWRPRYQRISAYSGGPPYLAASASEQHLHPAAAYNMIPSYSAPPVPTETISIALSPLAAAAAAAASALAVADKSRHHNHHWLTLPRLTTSTINQAPTTTASASTTHTQTLPSPGSFQTAAYIHRPNPFAMSHSMPIYAIAPRQLPTVGAPPAGLSNPAAASYMNIPHAYFHGGAPAIIAYRPTSVMPPASLLTAASFAYPLRLPVTTVPKAPSFGGINLNPTRGSSLRPFYSDLQYAETSSKSKSNLTTNTSDSSSGGKGLVKGGSLSAMAKNLTRKMFGSASQMRPTHVAAPSSFNSTATTYDLFSPLHDSASFSVSRAALS